MRTHDLKTRSVYFDALVAGVKTFDLRRNDRAFQAGDVVRFLRHDDYNDCDTIGCSGTYCSGPDWAQFEISYVFSGDPSLRDGGGVIPGYVVLAFSALPISSAVSVGDADSTEVQISSTALASQAPSAVVDPKTGWQQTPSDALSGAVEEPLHL